MSKGFKIQSDHKLSSDFLPADAFTRIYDDSPMAVATAIEGVDDPKEQKVCVIDLSNGAIVFDSTQEDYE